MKSLLQDLRYAFRSLRKSPGFTTVAVLTLALGMGGTIAIFSMVNAVLLRPFEYAEPDRIVVIGGTVGTSGDVGALSYPDFADVRERADVFSAIAAWDWHPYNLRAEDAAVYAPGGRVSAGFFEVLGVDPLLGRGFRAEDDRPGAPGVVILGESLWRTHFEADPGVVGRVVTLDGEPRTVIGVMPGYVGHPYEAHLWVPLGLDATQTSRGAHWLGVLARLEDGVTTDQARSGLSAIARDLERAHPETNRDRGLAIIGTLVETSVDLPQLLVLLLGASGFVLLIACANIASLLLGRTLERGREFAVRTALGASRGRIARHVLLESGLVGLVGSVLGLLLGLWTINGTLAWIPVELPAWLSLEADVRVFAFTALAGLAATLFFGLLPALHVARSAAAAGALEQTRGATGGHHQQRLRWALVSGEIALSLALLAGAGLMVRNLFQVSSIDPGFESTDRIIATMALPEAEYADQAVRVRFQRELISRVGTLPDVRSVGVISRFPLRGSSNGRSFTVEGQSSDEQQGNPFALTNSVGPDYFRSMGIPLLRRRGFTTADNADARPVAVINRTMARRYWPDDSPVGKRIKFGIPDDSAEWMEIVGVVGDIRHHSLEEAPSVQLYLPYAQNATTRLSVVAYTRPGAAAALADDLREQVQRIDPGQALYDVMTLERVVAEAFWHWSFFARLFWITGALALALAAIGIYGVIAYAVGLRTREIGIRVALGAARREVIGLVLWQGVRGMLIGIAVGTALALVTGRVMAAALYEVEAFDPLTLGVVLLVLTSVGLLASYLPARRAASVDPMTALRAE